MGTTECREPEEKPQESKPAVKPVRILVDTREQLPLWTTCKRLKLDVGDYTTDNLLNIYHVERKSPGDLYGSIVGDHERFRRELLRAASQNIQLVVFVECPEDAFYAKRWAGGYALKVKGNILAKIIHTIRTKYNTEFVFCKDRNDMKKKIRKLLTQKEMILRNQ